MFGLLILPIGSFNLWFTETSFFLRSISSSGSVLLKKSSLSNSLAGSQQQQTNNKHELQQQHLQQQQQKHHNINNNGSSSSGGSNNSCGKLPSSNGAEQQQQHYRTGRNGIAKGGEHIPPPSTAGRTEFRGKSKQWRKTFYFGAKKSCTFFDSFSIKEKIWTNGYLIGNSVSQFYFLRLTSYNKWMVFCLGDNGLVSCKFW